MLKRWLVVVRCVGVVSCLLRRETKREMRKLHLSVNMNGLYSGEVFCGVYDNHNTRKLHRAKDNHTSHIHGVPV